jgi:hypothetical protein
MKKSQLIILTGLFFLGTTTLSFSQVQKSNQDPQKPASPKDQKSQKAEPAKQEKVTYTCPMHPNVTSDKPGKCPECKMDLVKKESKATTYTCPMHPEITKTQPGKCPKCGMDLVKKKDDKKAEPKKP